MMHAANPPTPPHRFAVCGKTFDIVTLGCRVNHYEAEALAAMMVRRGAVFAPDEPSPDIVIVVTCSITSVADAKTRKLIRRVRRRNPQAAVAVCGCYAQSCSEEEARALGVDVMTGNRTKETIPDALERLVTTGEPFFHIAHDLRTNRSWDRLRMDKPRLHTRAFVKVQDGCGRSCSYCIVPQVRGAQVSRDPEDVVEEITEIAACGCSEVVLTGIHLGSYRCGDISLARLVQRISAVAGLKRLRFGSLEPFAVDETLLRALADSPLFCPHLHLPVQSGDDGVLLRMRRGYTASRFAQIVTRARDVLGACLHVSTDLIVGFPGEGEAAFRNSLSLLRDLGMGKVHVFPFSARAGTDAATMPETVPAGVVRERVARAVALSDELLADYAATFVGVADSMVTESVRDGVAFGWTRHYLRGCTAAVAAFSAGSETMLFPRQQIRGILLDEGVDSLQATDCPEY